MADTKEKKGSENLTPWKPGQSGNPKGSKPGYVQAKTVLKRLLAAKGKFVNPLTGKEEDMQLGDAMHLVQISKALKDNDTRAYEAIMDRVDGRPVQSLANDPDNPLPSSAPQLIFNVQSMQPITTEAALQKLLEDEQNTPG